ncbi:DUF4280 domain-containing protein [Paenibacillus sp. Leaf72]|uniref:DUF4280 domain-containing protein n=1 Tax=Paenibacillus sp. Leaf72 TaxID=1736234 RepID=UPI0006FE34B9|nr:DUF4280 domain-containing protein [Paenibacillus sp. Leaf72]KQO02120.1 hypothetical protein ASF12_33160 [Paenibacillus sp. Leaf72]
MEARSTVLKKATLKALLESPWRSEDTYVTAGAYMYCSKGTHEEVLSKQDPNGVYINGSPMLTVEDCVASTSVPGVIKGKPAYLMAEDLNGNFYSFGYCRSEHHPMKEAEEGNSLQPGYHKFIYDPDEQEPTFNRYVYPCAPQLLPTVSASAPAGAPFKPKTGSSNSVPSLLEMLENLKVPQVQWTNGSPNVSIQGVAALTSKSCLSCKYGGEIRLLTNGMDPVPPEFSQR